MDPRGGETPPSGIPLTLRGGMLDGHTTEYNGWLRELLVTEHGIVLPPFDFESGDPDTVGDLYRLVRSSQGWEWGIAGRIARGVYSLRVAGMTAKPRQALPWPLRLEVLIIGSVRAPPDAVLTFPPESDLDQVARAVQTALMEIPLNTTINEAVNGTRVVVRVLRTTPGGLVLLKGGKIRWMWIPPTLGFLMDASTRPEQARVAAERIREELAARLASETSATAEGARA
jgi:hypothetical protein